MEHQNQQETELFKCPIYTHRDVVRCTDLDDNSSFTFLLNHLKVKHSASDLAYFIARHIQDQIMR